MKPKHVAFVILMVMLFLTIGEISASDNITYFNNTTEITFEDVNFTIPEGFGENLTEDYDELGSHGKTAFYVNDNGEEITITVIYDWMGLSLDELYVDGSNMTTINGHEGWNYTDGNFTCFSYVIGDNGIIISSNNQTRIGEVMK